MNLIFKNIKILYPLRWSVKTYCNKNTKEILQLKPVLEKWKTKFQSAEIEDSNYNLKCLVAHTLNKNFSSLSELNNLTISESELKKLNKFCECRLARIPLQYIIGEWDFRNLTLKMMPSVFIPRPETEKLIDLVIDEVDNSEKFEFIEIGCGTGAITLSILNELENSQAIALDRSKTACNLTMENARLLRLENRLKIYNYKVDENAQLPDNLLEKKFDLIVSNPPYIKTNIIPTLPPEIKLYENLTALDGGKDGLKVAKILIELASKCLKINGKLFMELDESHPPLIEEIIKNQYNLIFKYVCTHKDIYEKNRFVEILKIS